MTRDIPAAIQTQREKREGIVSHRLLWVVARNRSTGDPESIGFWTGDDHQVFNIGGTDRLYFGAGAAIGMEPVVASIGLEVRYHHITMAPFVDEVQALIREYEPRQAKIEVHEVDLDLASMAPLATPFRIIKGTIQEVSESRARGDSRTVLKIASAARALTIGLPLYRSEAALKLRNANDRFREGVDAAGDRNVPWGIGRVRNRGGKGGGGGGGGGGFRHGGGGHWSETDP